MILWRISNFADLQGLGGLRFSGRWHTRGNPVVYLADSPASALLETIAHVNIDDLPDKQQLLEVDVGQPGYTEFSLDENWESNQAQTQKLGDDWIREREYPLLRVPSVLVPFTWNYVLNPNHPDSVIARIANVSKFELDPRLIKFPSSYE